MERSGPEKAYLSSAAAMLAAPVAEQPFPAGAFYAGHSTLFFAAAVFLILVSAGLVAAVFALRKNKRTCMDLYKENLSLRKTCNELREAEHNFQMILDNSRAIIITTDTEGRIVEFNREAEKLLEYTKQEVAGKDVLMLYARKMDRDELEKRERFTNGEVWEVRNREVELRSKSGKVYFVNLTLSTLVNERGGIIGTVGIGYDITEQRMLQFKLIQSEKLAGIGILASGIAHEINNPLAGILGMAEAIRDEDDPELVKTYAGDIIRYAVNASEIVKELSRYSRSASDESKSTIDLACVMENSLRMASHSASFVSIKVQNEFEDGCLVNANDGELQQVFINLIVNAIHAMEGIGTLRLGCRREGGLVKAFVSDTGCGIPQKFINQIYNPFFTTKPVGIGTGLGLYVVYRIVTRYGGTVDVETRPGRGTTFTISFPFCEEGAGEKIRVSRA